MVILTCIFVFVLRVEKGLLLLLLHSWELTLCIGVEYDEY